MKHMSVAIRYEDLSKAIYNSGRRPGEFISYSPGKWCRVVWPDHVRNPQYSNARYFGPYNSAMACNADSVYGEPDCQSHGTNRT